MKQLTDQDEAEILDLFLGMYYFQFLASAVELDLFTLLSRWPGLTREEVAEHLKLEIQPARILLLGCGAIGLLRKEGDRYFNTSGAERFFSKTQPANMVPAVRMANHIQFRPMARFAEALRSNTNVGLEEIPGSAPNLYMRLAENPPLEQIFHEMMSLVSFGTAAFLAGSLDLSRHRKLLDVGGGEAVNATTLAGRWPDLHVTVLDLPTVAETTNARLTEQGLAERVTALGGDCFSEELPAGFDAILFSRFLSIWSEEKVRGLLAKAARALPSGASLYVVDALQDDDEMGPPFVAHLCAYFLTLASGEGMARPWREWTDWLEEAGFTSVARQPLPGGMSEFLIEAVRV
ncbi:methyltransferase [Mycobacterium sp. NPDC051804]|uniref:methyltransferase n=1 Tax=Mycobacterium sp. NPDC051804 TaxID=3364295 RepID=UPI0037A0A490